MSRRVSVLALLPVALSIAACREDVTTAPVRIVPPNAPFSSSVSSNSASKIAFTANLGTGNGIVVSNADGTGALQVTTDNGGMPTWSPNGQQIAYEGSSGTSATTGLYIVNADGTNRTQLTFPAAAGSCQDHLPHWSPNGAKIAAFRYCGNVAVQPVIIVDVATGSITTLPVNGWYPQWSPDGQHITFTAYGLQQGDLYKIKMMNPDGSNVTTLYTHVPGGSSGPPDPEWSPDGTRIAFGDEGQTGIYIMNADGTGVTRIKTGRVEHPSWSPDGTQILYDSANALYLTNTAGTGRVLVGPGRFADWSKAPPDSDGDGVADPTDNCPTTANPSQSDADHDGIGDACDADNDNDGVLDLNDNCPSVANADQADADFDGLGNACDPDDDNDGVPDGSDNCPTVANASQADLDGDGIGDVCDPDDDGDGVSDATDNCPTTPNQTQSDADNDGIGDACDTDADNDGVPDATDNCRNVANPTQGNVDGDSLGDLCDPDDDNDRLYDGVDDNPIVVGSHFTRGPTGGTLGASPPGVTVTVGIGSAPNSVLVTYLRTSGSGAAMVTVDLDGAGYNWQADAQNCTPQACSAQLTRSPSGTLVRLESTAGLSTLSGTLYGAPSLITVSAGGTAIMTETVTAGALTDALVTAAGTGAVMVNGLTIPSGMTAAIGKLVAKSSLSGGKTKSLTVTGTLTQSASSDGLDPLTEAVVFQVGGQTWTVNAGGFTLANGGSYNYSATVSAVQITIQLKKSKANEWTIKLTATPSTQATPTNIGLRVGNDVGVTTG